MPGCKLRKLWLYFQQIGCSYGFAFIALNTLRAKLPGDADSGRSVTTRSPACKVCLSELLDGTINAVNRAWEVKHLLPFSFDDELKDIGSIVIGRDKVLVLVLREYSPAYIRPGY